MKRTFTTALLLFGLAVGGCRDSEVTSEAPRESPTQRDQASRADTVTEEELADRGMVPAGTLLELRLEDTIGTENSQVGDDFEAMLLHDLMTEEGELAIPAGATVTGIVTELKRSERIGEQAAIRIEFEEIAFQDRAYNLEGAVIETEFEEERSGRRTAAGAGIGAAAGAALGAIIGRDVQSAVLGGAAGAGAGTLISLGTGDVDAKLEQGTEMTVRLEEPIDVTRGIQSTTVPTGYERGERMPESRDPLGTWEDEGQRNDAKRGDVLDDQSRDEGRFGDDSVPAFRGGEDDLLENE